MKKKNTVPEMHEVESSNIAKVGYEAKDSSLYLEFHSGKTYRYWPITNEFYKELLAADSIGSFAAKNLYKNPRVNQEQIQ